MPTAPNLPILALMPIKFDKPHHETRKDRLAQPDTTERPKVTARARREVYEKFRAHTDEVLEMLVGIVRNDEADDTSRIAAGKEILSRGWGAVAQTHIIEALFEHKQIIDVSALRQLPQDQLTQLEASLARLVDVQYADVIDGEATEQT